ncbi:MAG: hypothetical protein JWN51_3802 [Phycisphaerales bacterium]|nr:hypothetical protein [Phycisphaerales bacterium]
MQGDLDVTVRRVRIGFVGGAVCASAMIGYGLFATRTTLGPPVRLAIAGATCVLVAYAVVGLFIVPRSARRHPEAFRLGYRAGVALGLIFLCQVFGEYIAPITARADQLIGWIVFGGLLPLTFCLGAAAATAGARAGALAAFWAMLIGSLAWVNGLLLAYLCFWGSHFESRLFTAEGVARDFAQSGEQDLRAFLMTDYLGACFFHLTLAPLIGVCVGAAGAFCAITARGALRLARFGSSRTE